MNINMNKYSAIVLSVVYAIIVFIILGYVARYDDIWLIVILGLVFLFTFGSVINVLKDNNNE